MSKYGIAYNDQLDYVVAEDELESAIEYVNQNYTLHGDTHVYVAQIELVGDEYVITDRIYPKR